MFSIVYMAIKKNQFFLIKNDNILSKRSLKGSVKKRSEERITGGSSFEKTPLNPLGGNRNFPLEGVYQCFWIIGLIFVEYCCYIYVIGGLWPCPEVFKTLEKHSHQTGNQRTNWALSSYGKPYPDYFLKKNT